MKRVHLNKVSQTNDLGGAIEQNSEGVVISAINSNLIVKDTIKCFVCGKKFPTYIEFAKHSKIHLAVQSEKVHTACRSLKTDDGGCDLKKLHVDTHFKVSKHNIEVCRQNSTVSQLLRTKADLKSFAVEEKGELSQNKVSRAEEDAGETKQAFGGTVISMSNRVIGNSTRNGENGRHRPIFNNAIKMKFKCYVCGKKFGTCVEFAKHTSTHPSDSKCGKSNNASTSIRDLETHVGIRNCLNPTSSHFLKSNVQIKKSIKQYECSFCRKRFPRKTDLSRHMLFHSGFKNLKCEVCGKGFSLERALKVHMHRHVQPDKFKCRICGKGFHQEHRFTEHMSVHSKVEDYKCKVCDKVFARACLLRRHMQRHVEGKQFKCDICQNSFTSYSYLRKHELSHTNPRSFKCEICGKAYSFSTGLASHMYSHTESGYKRCKICGKTFENTQRFDKHMAVHMEDRNFKCKICPKAFKHKSNLDEHMVTHDPKNIECEVCGKSYGFRSRWKRHMKTHSEKFKCDICAKIFSRREHLLRHLSNHDVVEN